MARGNEELTNMLARFLCEREGRDPDRKWRGRTLAENYVDQASAILSWLSQQDLVPIKEDNTHKISSQGSTINANVTVDNILSAYVREWNNSLIGSRMDRDGTLADPSYWSVSTKNIYMKCLNAAFEIMFIK